MTRHWDEFSKSLAEKSVPRRESLRLLGAALAGAILSPLGLETAWAAGADPCKSFCNRCPKSRRSSCLANCRACNSDPSRLCGDCGSIVCCDEPAPYENGACVDGQCTYWCVDGAAACGGGPCIPLWADPNNCGACGNVCPDTAPVCIDGVCSPNPCGGGEVYCPHAPVGPGCTDLRYDSYNCGACGIVCGGPCNDGVCYSEPPSDW